MRANTDAMYSELHQLAQVVQVSARIRRQILYGAGCMRGFLPAGQDFIHWFALFVYKWTRQIFKALSPMAVGDTHGDFWQTVEYIQLGNGQVGAAIEFADVTRDDCVKPANAARTTGGGTKLAAKFAQGGTAL